MDVNILIKYLEQKLNDVDTSLVEAWIQASPDNRKIVEQLDEILFINDRVLAFDSYNSDNSYNIFKDAIQENISKNNRKTYSLFKRIASVAAVAVIFLLAGTFATVSILDNTNDTVTVNTNLGERAQVDLPDGSKVWLNACSSLEYKRSLLSLRRIAKIEGEGYFEVAKNKIIPFVVHNSSAQIKVLGTNFNVKSNNDEPDIVVSLIEGSISFDDNGDYYAILKPNERLIYNKLSHQYKIETIVPDDEVTAWLKGRIIFKNTPFEEMARTLVKHYNVKIKFLDDNVKQKRFTAEFGVSDNIYQIFSILALTNTFEYNINDREIIIKSIAE